MMSMMFYTIGIWSEIRKFKTIILCFFLLSVITQQLHKLNWIVVYCLLCPFALGWLYKLLHTVRQFIVHSYIYLRSLSNSQIGLLSNEWMVDMRLNEMGIFSLENCVVRNGINLLAIMISKCFFSSHFTQRKQLSQNRTFFFSFLYPEHKWVIWNLDTTIV